MWTSTSTRSNSLNQGVSEFDLPERAYTRKQSDGEIRIGHRSTIRKQWVNNLRFQYEWQKSEAESSSDAMTIRVLDAFTIGGAQLRGGRRTQDFNIENELEFTVRKTHQMAFGAMVTGSTYAVDEVRNTNGTFTFASLEMYQAGLPTTYTQRTINPNGSYSMQRFWLVPAGQLPREPQRDDQHDAASRCSDTAVGLGEFLTAHRRKLDAAWPADDACAPASVCGRSFLTAASTSRRCGRTVCSSAISSSPGPGYPDPFSGGDSAREPAT